MTSIGTASIIAFNMHCYGSVVTVSLDACWIVAYPKVPMMLILLFL